MLIRPLDRCYEISKEPQDKITFRPTATDWAKESNNKIISVLCLNGPMLCQPFARFLSQDPRKVFSTPVFLIIIPFYLAFHLFPHFRESYINRHRKSSSAAGDMSFATDKKKKKKTKIYKSEIMHHFGLPEALSVSLLLRFANRLVVSRR